MSGEVSAADDPAGDLSDSDEESGDAMSSERAFIVRSAISGPCTAHDKIIRLKA